MSTSNLWELNVQVNCHLKVVLILALRQLNSIHEKGYKFFF